MQERPFRAASAAVTLSPARTRRTAANFNSIALAKELGIRRKRLYVWKDRYGELGEAGLRRAAGRQTAQGMGGGGKHH